MNIKQILDFISNQSLQLSAINAGIWFSALDWTIKVAFGLPSTVYICLKIYHEFIKAKKES